MEAIVYIVVGIGLFISTITDIKSKKVYLSVIFTVSIVTFLLNLYMGNIVLYETLGVIITGLTFFVISFITGGQLGMGDVCIYIMTGIGLGIAGNIYLIFISFFTAAFGALYLVIFKKKKRNYRMPLVPYIMIGYIIYIIDKAGGITGVV